MGYKNSVIGGFTGPKGGGKSLSMAAAIVHELLSGRRVWSNMKVKVSPALLNRRYFYNGETLTPRETEPLDWDLFYMLDESMIDGTVAIDEITYQASSRQSMATTNKLINTGIRQARHRQLNFLYTAKKFGWVDSHLREETDFVVTCEDMTYQDWGDKHQVDGGLAIRQRYYDVSGQLTGHMVNMFSTDAYPYKTCIFHGRPYWECYDTREIISIEEALSGVRLDLRKRVVSNRDTFSDETAEIVMEALVELKSAGNKRVPNDMLWALLDKKGVSGSPNTLGRYIPKTVRRMQTRGEGYMYDISKI